MKVPVESKILAGFIVTTVTLGGVGWLSYRAMEDFITAQGWVTHTHEVISQLETTLTTVIETDTEQRGYLLTGDAKFLTRRQAAAARIPAGLQKIQELTIDNPVQQKAVKELENLTQRQVAEEDNRIAIFQKSGLQAAFAQEPMEKTEGNLNDVGALAAQMRATEEKLLARRQEEFNRLAKQTERVIITGSVAAVIIGWMIVLMGRRELRLRALAEARLNQNEERLRLMISAVRDYAILLLVPEGNVASWNDGARQIKGYTAEEIIGQKFSKFFPPEAIEAGLPEKLLKEAAEKGRFEDTGWRVRKDGSRFWAHVIATAVRNPEGKLLGYVKVTQDLTERKRAEQVQEERDRYFEKIEQLNTDLQYHAGQLEAANKELEAFSYSVSHDLRAPLRHIDGFVKMLTKQSEEKLDERGRRYLNIIADSAQRMGALIDDLLVFSRMSRAELHCSHVSTEALVHEAVEGLELETKNRKIQWKIDALPDVEADGAMLQQVWVNLISNAVKYTRPRPSAEIEIGCNDMGNGEYVFFVQDNGVGFDMQYAHKLFGVFQRLHRSEEFEGTGIGLANVSRIIHRHGGRAWAESKLDAGATFYFSLPKKQLKPNNRYGSIKKNTAGGRQ